MSFSRPHKISDDSQQLQTHPKSNAARLSTNQDKFTQEHTQPRAYNVNKYQGYK